MRKFLRFARSVPAMAVGLALLGFVSIEASAQCTAVDQYPSLPVSPTADIGFQDVNSCNWAGEYAVVDVVAGDTYEF